MNTYRLIKNRRVDEPMTVYPPEGDEIPAVGIMPSGETFFEFRWLEWLWDGQKITMDDCIAVVEWQGGFLYLISLPWLMKRFPDNTELPVLHWKITNQAKEDGYL